MELIKLLPDYYDRNVTMQVLQEILSGAAEELEDGLDEAVRQCFVVTASSLLSRWERIFGLEVDISKSDIFRRERVMAKIAGAGTTTKAMIVDVASRYSNGAVEVIEDNANSRFTIRFVGTVGIPVNMEWLKITIEEIKPAHLQVIYEYIYNTWKDIKNLTWKGAAAYTWEQIKEVDTDARNDFKL